MAKVDPNRMIPILQKAGFTGEGLRTAYAIMRRESGGNPGAYNPKAETGDQSYGLFQINMLGNLGPARRKQFGLTRNEELYNPLRNAQIAYQMSKGGTDWGAWAYGPNAYRDAPGLNELVEKYKSEFPGAARGVTAMPSATGVSSVPSFGGGPDGSGTQFAINFINQIVANRRLKSRGQYDAEAQKMQMVGMLMQQRQQALQRQSVSYSGGTPTPPAAAVAATGGDSGGALRELFYDPLGAYDEGKFISPIGGHTDHVHASINDPQAMIAAIKLAQSMGLRASENPYAEHSAVEPVHTEGSYHYQYFPGMYEGWKLGKGLDVSGDPEKMAAYYREILKRYR